MSTRTTRHRAFAQAAAMTAVAVLAAACGSARPGYGGSPGGPPTASLPLATALGGSGQPAWAVVDMGGSAASHDNFWELLVRPAGSAAQWKLATPPGVASNGGLMMSANGSGVLAGFGPSQYLTFSPLATTSGPAAAWSQGGALVSPGLASVPDALAAGPQDQVLALTRTGEVLLGSHGGSAWTRLLTLRTAAASPAGRACGLTALTAVSFSPAGTPLVAGTCTQPGQTGVFAAGHGTLRSVSAPTPPTSRAAGAVTVLALSTQAGRTAALISLGAGKKASVVAAWWAGGTSPWTLSPALGTGRDPARSASLWPGGGAGVILAGGRGAVVSGPGSAWRSLPALPARTAALAEGQAGQIQALAAGSNELTVWQLSASGATWSRLQVIKVTIPYGSSG